MCTNYLGRVFDHLSHQNGDVIFHAFVRIPEAHDGRGEDVGLDHHLRQAHRVFADLTESGEYLPLCGDKRGCCFLRKTARITSSISVHRKTASDSFL